jgi:hypothetical protein
MPFISVGLIESKSAPGNSFVKVCSTVSARRFPQITETKTSASKMDTMILFFIFPPYHHTNCSAGMTPLMQDTYQNTLLDLQPRSESTLNSFSYPGGWRTHVAETALHQ